MLIDNIGKLKLRHNFLSKRVAKMERERETVRATEHKALLTELKKLYSSGLANHLIPAMIFVLTF